MPREQEEMRLEISASLEHLLSTHGVGFLAEVLIPWQGHSALEAANSAEFSAQAAAAAWKTAPLQIRVSSPETLGWSKFIGALPPIVFDLSGTTIRLHDDWARRLQAALSGVSVAPNNATTAEAPPIVPSPAGTVASAGAAKSVQPSIGIDLGTTYSVVAFLDHQGRPTSILNGAGELLTPSVVLFEEEGPIVGKQAVLASPLRPGNVAECVKRDMGAAHFRHPIRGEFLPPEVISSFILRSLKADAERRLGPVSNAVITVPAYFNEARRRATMDAGRIAGLNVLDILNEPTAAAIAYGFQEGFLDREGRVRGDQPLRALVYDLGGGTFDVTVVEMANRSFKALATDGDVRLGGKEWDEKLVDLAAEKFRALTGQDPRQDPESRQELWLAAEAAKRTLSQLVKATLVVNCRGQRQRVEITRRELEEATHPLLLRTRTTTELVVMQAGFSWSQIDKVLLAGGSTRMPMVQRMLRELTGKVPDQTISADEAIAHGAALYADLLVRGMGAQPEPPAFAVQNVNSHSLGVAGVHPQSGQRVNAKMIPKNTPLPKTATRKFQTASPNQSNISIRVLEGESELPEACAQVGVCTIRGLPPNLPAGWPVEVKFSYEENGRLKVAGKLMGHDAGAVVEFVRDNCLSDDDLLLWAETLAAANF